VLSHVPLKVQSSLDIGQRDGTTSALLATRFNVTIGIFDVRAIKEEMRGAFSATNMCACDMKISAYEYNHWSMGFLKSTTCLHPQCD
jgi:hypothetical protein